MGVQVSVGQKINKQINIVSKKRPNMWSTSAQTETCHRSPPGPAQAQQEPPGARPPPPPHRFRLDLAAVPPSSNWVNLWLSDLHSSLMDAIRKGVSLKKVEVDEGKYDVEATTLLQRRLAVGMFSSGELEEEEDEWEDF